MKGIAESYKKLRGSLFKPDAIVGKDAYEIAVAEGFDGTREEWLLSLKGAKIVKTELIGQDENGGNIYRQTFDNGVTNEFIAPKGETGETGEKGDTGDTPVKGEDYFTPEDVTEIVNAVLENMKAARIGEVVLYADKWVGNASPFSQVVNVAGATENSQVDLTPSVEQLAIFHRKDLAFVTENEDGVVTVYAIGDKPMNDYTIQVTITEVVV